MLQYVKSFVFVVLMYIMLPLYALAYAPWALLSSKGAHAACHAFSRYVFWSLEKICGLKCEVRGIPPTENAIVAAKHMSFLDVFMIYNAIPRGYFIMKKLLLFSPFVGQYAIRIGCVGVHRGKRAEAIQKLKDDVANDKANGGQLIIYPQGTRTAPGQYRPYKVGTAILYEQLDQPCYPVAANVGLFWAKRGILRKPGTAVIEFLPPIQAGLPKEEFLAELERVVEEGSNSLMREAGFDPKGKG